MRETQDRNVKVNGKPRRSWRKRGTPEWLQTGEGLDELAQRRCLLVLSVLSGEKSVTEVIAEAELTRQTYYNLETRALSGMLAALRPGSEIGTAAGPEARVMELEQQLKKADTSKRRLERLLLWTRRVVKKGPIKQAPGRPRGRGRRNSTAGGAISSTRSSKPKPSSSSPEIESPSTPTRDGADAL